MSIELLKAKLEMKEEEDRSVVIWAASVLADLPEDKARPILNIIEQAQLSFLEEQFRSAGKES